MSKFKFLYMSSTLSVSRLALGSSVLGLAIFTAAMIAPVASAQTLPPQSIYEEDIGVAAVYDVGVIDSSQGGMSPTLWNGTSARTALSVIKAAPIKSKSAATLDLVANALLSGGTPPQGALDDDAYTAARLSQLAAMGRSEDAEAILNRRSDLSGSPIALQFRADAGLLSGQVDQACLIADGVQDQRGEPYWAKLRAFCHVTRDEVPAAELTADLLKRSGHEADAFYRALRAITGINTSEAISPGGDPLLTAMDSYVGADAEAASLSPETLLENFIANAPSLSAEAYATAMSDIVLAAQRAAEGDALTGEAVGGYFDLDETLASDAPEAWGQLYGVVKNSTDAGVTAKAASGLLARAKTAGIFESMARQLKPELSFIPAQLRAQNDLDSFVQLAVLEGDLGALRVYYETVGADDPQKSRIALASDAIGNGFVLGELGQDMTARLQGENVPEGQGAYGVTQRAVRDTFIAVSLGARMSDAASEVMSAYASTLPGNSANPARLWALKDAAAKGAQAETALRAAAILGEGGPSALRADSLAVVLESLADAGLRDMAGRIAAEDFIN